MDTLITISVVSGSGDKAEKAIDKAFGEIEKLDRLLNFFSDSSEVSEINRNAGLKAVAVSPETFAVLEKAVYASGKTDGAFDVTIGSVTTMWDFHKRTKPEDKKIKERLPLVNYKNIILNKKSSSVYLKKKGMLIDLGGIAKGYAADKAVEALKREGIKSGLVSIAGDIKAFGLKPDSKPWKIGIRNPRAIPPNPPLVKGGEGGFSDEIMATIEMTDMAISTSGDYERYFIVDKKRYHHILNPKTGYPAEGCRSVSIIAKDGAVTDPFSTGIFILGAEKGIKLLEEMGIDGIIVDKNGKIHTTPNLRGKLEIIGDSQRRKRTD
ncbi:MAG: FAD:protein FMN transferase [Thermodesulfovibrionales bacterium]|nr:FAD:protein FMN transferase [Nitrospinota bacterium]MCG2709446.1 FAD:protein FMN transferase [Thermodesulfovibrionales bacterium]MCG2813262.1 FAD:protein FMN transferase [Thermodesulfovibrionales bacterium]